MSQLGVTANTARHIPLEWRRHSWNHLLQERLHFSVRPGLGIHTYFRQSPSPINTLYTPGGIAPRGKYLDTPASTLAHLPRIPFGVSRDRCLLWRLGRVGRKLVRGEQLLCLCGGRGRPGSSGSRFERQHLCGR